MKQLMSLPMTARTLTEYPDLPAACREAGCRGLEVVWGGEPLPCDVPQDLHIGYHLTFWPDWLDFWNGDEDALLRKFGSEEAWTAFYGGPAGRETLLSAYRADLDRAVAWGARYVVFHVSNVSLSEGFTYRWEHSDRAVVDASVEAANRMLEGRGGPFAFLVENQWWPGFTFTRPALTRRLLEGISYGDKGIMLDIGHLMNTDPGLKSQAEGADYLRRMLEAHGPLRRAVRGVHLHQSVSGAYVRSHTGRLPEDWNSGACYLSRSARAYEHVLRIDTHRPWSDPSIARVVREIAPEYLVHELYAGSRRERSALVRAQRETLRRGGLEL